MAKLPKLSLKGWVADYRDLDEGQSEFPDPNLRSNFQHLTLTNDCSVPDHNCLQKNAYILKLENSSQNVFYVKMIRRNVRMKIYLLCDLISKVINYILGKISLQLYSSGNKHFTYRWETKEMVKRPNSLLRELILF